MGMNVNDLPPAQNPNLNRRLPPLPPKGRGRPITARVTPKQTDQIIRALEAKARELDPHAENFKAQPRGLQNRVSTHQTQKDPLIHKDALPILGLESPVEKVEKSPVEEVENKFGNDFEALKKKGVSPKSISEAFQNKTEYENLARTFFKEEIQFLASLGVPDKAITELIEKGHIANWTETNLRLRTPYEMLAKALPKAGASLRSTVLEGMGKLYAGASKLKPGTGEAVGMGPANVIVYKGKEGVVKFANWSGETAPVRGKSESFLGQGTFGIAQKVVLQKITGVAENLILKAKALKTPVAILGEEAQRDLINEVEKIEYYHSTHRGGSCPGIQKKLKEVKIATDEGVVTAHMGKMYKATLEGVKGPDAALLVRGFKDMFHGLAHIHNLKAPTKERSVHMDIKDANAFYDGETFRLGDFGGVRRFTELDRNNWRGGTPVFMTKRDYNETLSQLTAPKDVLNLRQKMDIFAMGSMLWSMASGSKTTYYQLEQGGFQGTQIDPNADQYCREMKEKYGAEVVNTMLRMLDQNPNKRPTAAQCEKVFQKVEAKLAQETA